MAEKGSTVDIISLSVPSIPDTQGRRAVVAPILDFIPYFIDFFSIVELREVDFSNT